VEERPVSTLHERLLDHLRDLDVVLDEDRYDMTEPVAALRAVVELHAPASDQPQLCRTCWNEGAEDYHGWPCSTIQAIARELGVDDHG
jgi:hypothetical protein